MERLRLGATFAASPKEVYEAWISGELHSKMTGSPATSEGKSGGAFTAWDGYILGKYIELEPGRRILQSWRTTDFPAKAPDSLVEIRLAKTGVATRLTLLQSDIPDGQSEMYADGWQKFYFDPMSAYFGETPAPAARSKEPTTQKPATKKPATKKPATKKPATKKTARAGGAVTARRGAGKKAPKSPPARKTRRASKR